MTTEELRSLGEIRRAARNRPTSPPSHHSMPYLGDTGGEKGLGQHEIVIKGFSVLSASAHVRTTKLASDKGGVRKRKRLGIKEVFPPMGKEKGGGN